MRTSTLPHGCRPEKILYLVSLGHYRRLRGTPCLVVPGDGLQFTVCRFEHHGSRQRLAFHRVEGHLDLAAVILPTAEQGSGSLAWVLGNRSGSIFTQAYTHG